MGIANPNSITQFVFVMVMAVCVLCGRNRILTEFHLRQLDAGLLLRKPSFEPRPTLSRFSIAFLEQMLS